MFGHTYRYQAHNATGAAVTVTVKDRAWKFAGDGSRTDAAEATHINAASVAAAAYANSATVDNSAVKNLGSHVTATFAPSVALTGTVTLFLQHSTDGGVTWPTDGKGVFVASHHFNAATAAVALNAEI